MIMKQLGKQKSEIVKDRKEKEKEGEEEAEERET